MSRIVSRDEESRARAILAEVLAAEFTGADAYRAQLAVAELRRTKTGFDVTVDRRRVAPATFDPRHPPDELPVAASRHGNLVVPLHVHEGYLDDVELFVASTFPEVETVEVINDEAPPRHVKAGRRRRRELPVLNGTVHLARRFVGRDAPDGHMG